MHGAGFQGRAEIAQLLFDHNVKHIAHDDGFFPLHRACWGREKRHRDTVKVFVTNGVDVDLKARNGDTCRSIATTSNNKQLLNLLNEWKQKKDEL